MQIKYFSIAFAETATTNVLPPDNQGNLTPRKIFDILSRKLNMEIRCVTPFLIAFIIRYNHFNCRMHMHHVCI